MPVELLVVGIVAILVAVLLPVLAQARQRGERKVLMTETWYRGGYWDSEGTSRVWSEGHGWYAASGGVSATGPNWEARHMRGRAVTVAYMCPARWSCSIRPPGPPTRRPRSTTRCPTGTSSTPKQVLTRSDGDRKAERS